jgi:hypothetical protein
MLSQILVHSYFGGVCAEIYGTDRYICTKLPDLNISAQEKMGLSRLTRYIHLCFMVQ